MPKVMDLSERAAEMEKQKTKELLEELPKLGPGDLPNWSIKAHTLLVFIAMRNPQALFEDQ